MFNDGVSGFRLEMSTIYLGFNIENVTFKINKKNLVQGNVTFNINTTSSFPREFPFVYMKWAHPSASHRYPAHLLTQMTFRDVQRSVRILVCSFPM